MKRKISHLLIIGILLSILIISCEEKVEEKKMTMVLASPEVKFEIAGTGYLTIDWGDDTKPEQFTLTTYPAEHRHQYLSEKTHTIILNGWVSYLRIGHFYIDENYYSNQLISFDAGNNNSLIYLDCSENIITNLDISKCTGLKELHCWNNQLTSLNLSGNKALIILKCWNNQLSNLDVSKNVELAEMTCSNNKINNLNISHNTKLKELYCNHNLLTGLDANKNIELNGLYCHNNQLTSFDASHNNKLKGLYINNNQLNTHSLNALFTSLHNNTISGGKSICISNNPGTKFCDTKIATYKGWSVF
jgi:hypothetical protein